MAHKDQLALLINSLTPAEKKYFVQFTSLRSDDKSYMKLYEAILKSGVYNADVLSKELGKSKANLAHEKEYLTENILKALRNYHDKMPEVAVHNAVAEVALLNEKKLFELSNIRLKKALARAKDSNKNEIIWRAKYDQQAALYSTLSTRKFLNACDQTATDMEKCIDYMKTFTALYRLSNQIDKIFAVRTVNRNEQDDKEVSELMQHPLLQSKFTEPQFKMVQHELHSTLFQLLREKKKALDQTLQALVLAEKYPLQLQMNSYGYFVKVHGYITDFIATTAATDFKGFEKFMQQLPERYSKLPFNRTYLDNMFKAYAYGYYLTFYFRLLSRKEVPEQRVTQFLSDLEKNLQFIKQHASELYFANILWRVAFLHFLLKDYDASLKWFNKTLNNSHPKTSVENQYKARVGILIVHAQQKNYSLLPHLMETTKRYLKQINYWRKVEIETFALLQKLHKLNTQKERKEAFALLYAKYDQIQNTETMDKRSLRIFIYPLWVEQNL